ncbi:type VI secretion protein [Streptomyces sp. V4-01]|uniref:Type VI secretion protein n=1 Tax=Actinacidiphila polyblastidii TaxID=3110430 RepID=A0ABU7PJ42_9ACTN|nr:type VI secretion protein [Streptomyces sp. V4-01]
MAGRRKEQPGGLPDGLVVGLIALLLGVTLMVWTATGVAGLLSHGGWPSAVHFTRTPRAMRALVQRPHDVAAAWPGAPRGELPGSGMFWGVFVGQFMVLAVVAVWALNAVARLRSRGLRKPAPPVLEELPVSSVPRPRRRGAPARAPRPRRDPYGASEPRGDQDAPGGEDPREAGAAREDDGSLDAWFRTVPRATPFTTADPPTTQLPPAFAGAPPTGSGEVRAAAVGRGDPLLAALADGEVTRTYALFADPRGDKGKRIVQPAVLAAAGPVVVTLADPETYHQTVGNRAKLGPVHVYDPAHVLDVPGRLRWAPHSGCAEPQAARARSAALLAPLRTDRADEAIVHDTAATLLRCWLHAAAVGGLPFRQIQRWAAGGTAAGEAVRILRTDTAAVSGWSGELESVLHAHPERRDAALGLIRRITEPLNSVHIRDACSPGRTGGLDWESFTSERGTLYVVGERVEDPRTRPGAMPLLTALLSSVVEHGRGIAAGSSSGRLDPPMTFVLDDVAALAPLPALPELLAEGHPAGLPTLAVLRSPEQALARWGAPVWQHADLRLALGEEPPAVPDAVRLH